MVWHRRDKKDEIFERLNVQDFLGELKQEKEEYEILEYASGGK